MWKIDELTRDMCMFVGLTSATFGTFILAIDKLGFAPPNIQILQALFWSSIIATFIFGGFAIYGAILLVKRGLSQNPKQSLNIPQLVNLKMNKDKKLTSFQKIPPAKQR